MKHWDEVNKWLYLGPFQNSRWVIMFDNWLCWGKSSYPTMRQWSLFRILWDDGAWWAFDLDNTIILNGKKKGYLECFWQIEIFGIGIRRYHKRLVEVEFKKRRKDE